MLHNDDYRRPRVYYFPPDVYRSPFVMSLAGDKQHGLFECDLIYAVAVLTNESSTLSIFMAA